MKQNRINLIIIVAFHINTLFIHFIINTYRRNHGPWVRLGKLPQKTDQIHEVKICKLVP